ncbi:hypothetical protein ACTWQF_08955 [Streptomyces sp. 8N114]|uniref:hypothetical protein n=1 Tax=Streptomyces sp. 8N114 TaxID=3457419 RepID=UPI003FD44B58
MSAHRTPPDLAAPDGLPTPRPFGHLSPQDGACLMEAASLLTGGFTDSPRTTHPMLAALARVVNDTVDDSTRHGLWPLVADLARAYPRARDFAPIVIGEVLREAQRVRPHSRTLHVRRTLCRRRALRVGQAAAPTPVVRRLDALWWRGPGRHHLEHALRVLLRTPDVDERLARLLREAVALATGRALAAEAGPSEPCSLEAGVAVTGRQGC